MNARSKFAGRICLILLFAQTLHGEVSQPLVKGKATVTPENEFLFAFVNSYLSGLEQLQNAAIEYSESSRDSTRDDPIEILVQLKQHANSLRAAKVEFGKAATASDKELVLIKKQTMAAVDGLIDLDAGAIAGVKQQLSAQTLSSDERADRISDRVVASRKHHKTLSDSSLALVVRLGNCLEQSSDGPCKRYQVRLKSDQRESILKRIGLKWREDAMATQEGFKRASPIEQCAAMIFRQVFGRESESIDGTVPRLTFEALFASSPAPRVDQDAVKNVTKPPEILLAECNDQSVGVSCAILGEMQSQGKGVRQDVPKGAALLSKACGLGVGYACYSLGAIYTQGKSIKQDKALGETLFRKACELGEGDGCVGIAVYFENDKAIGAKLFQRACSAGSGLGCLLLGVELLAGENVTRDEAEGWASIKRACDLGLATGCTRLGAWHGRMGNRVQSVELYVRACDLGDGAGCANLSGNYERGLGVDQDQAKAAKLLDKACGLGHSKACK